MPHGGRSSDAARAAAALALAVVAGSCGAPGTTRSERLPILPAPPVLVTGDGGGGGGGGGQSPPAAECDAHSWETGEGKSYAIPAVEILSFNVLLNLFDRLVVDDDGEFDSDLDSIVDNLSHGTVIDGDDFSTNQFQHPYGGSIYHGFARSAGLDFWEALGYDFAGSALWEIAGETTPPSANDLVATSLGGSFLGEALFRMSSWILEEGGRRPSWTREVGAALVAPSSAFNRHVFGERFADVFPSRGPAVTTRVRVGGGIDAWFTNAAGSRSVDAGQAFADVAFEYGLPGKPGYEYDRPFDYFRFDAGLSTEKDALVERVTSRGLLAGEKYGEGDVAGVWGLYGSYDYIAPRIFRVSSSALSAGTTAQWLLGEDFAFQGTGLAGVGYGAAGNVDQGRDERDYHYGITPQALIGVRFVLGELAMLDVEGRDYFVSDLASDGGDGSENVARVDASLTFRIAGPHAVGIQYVGSWRDARYSDLPDRDQSVGTVSLFYCLLGGDDFGVVR
jgi:hypothetical protein